MRFLEKAAGSAADVVFVDLEDSVAASEKAAARGNAVVALRDLDWGGTTVSLRLNGLDTPWARDDAAEVLAACGPRLDLVMLPKASSVADVAELEALVAAAWPHDKPPGLELIIETALGLVSVEAVAAAAPRVEALHFGPGDFAASVGARTTAIGDRDGARSEELWAYPLARINVAAKAFGLRALDGPYADFWDEAGLAASAGRSAALGFDGKWAIHPAQIEIINAAFTPDAAEVAAARRILDAMEEGEAAGRGAVIVDGRMVDVASVRQAQGLVTRADRIAALGRGDATA